MKGSFRASMAWLHTTLGLITGWVLFAIALSGSLSVYRQEITLWMHPELASQRVDPIQACSRAIDWLGQHAGTAAAWYVACPTPQAPFATGIWPNAQGAYSQRVLDPQSGSPDGLRDTLGGEFFYRFHFELQLPYPWGRLIAAIAALALVVALVTGIIIHRRIFADFFTFRPNKGQRSWLDAHNLLGVAALPFHLMISLTGAVTLASLLLPWSTQAVYHHDERASYTELNPALYARPASGQPGHLVPILPLIQMADRHFRGAGIAQIYVFNPSDRASLVTFISGNSQTVSTSARIMTFDGVTGQLLNAHTETRPVIRLYTFLYGLHVARFAPALTRGLYFVSGLALAVVIGSGMHLWAIKRLRQRPHIGHLIVNRLNTGILAGTPLAFATYFLANRLLPPALAGRSGYEVRSVFVMWALALVFALFRRPGRAWPELLGGNMLACLAIALLSMPWGSAATLGAGSIALGLAGAFGYATLRTARRA
ncbi:PepSY-associated TM helix domain-containing protein [Komagataeibacter xylinus]|uniref:PepSY-associated TM helix domain-containing protein n=1 Tax=Komagataeibacter xylinus TaxID=28448 RepID=UPI00280BB8F1|nr:PepSY-associated TM helix domain-containing protein [Komagataeibacter xylinus]